ncbi:MAG: nucleotide pyrophosphohydrolase [Flavobacteriales bacterium]|nr:nucleotide pyrophosphohydrolase [Flavobacteriales bacterium]
MSIQQLQQQVDEWIKKYGVRYFNELTNMAILSEEVGEVARIMARKYGEQSFKESDNSDLGEELADVLFVLLCIANQTDVNLQESFDNKLKIKTMRDANRHLGNPKLK